MNVAFKHLEAKLRFGELTIGQWAGGRRRAAVRARVRAVPEPGRRAVGHGPRRLPRRGAGQRGVLCQPQRVRPRGAAAPPRCARRRQPGALPARRRRDGARLPARWPTTSAAPVRSPAATSSIWRRCGTDRDAHGARDARRRDELPEAGDLLAVEAIDRTGLRGHRRGRVRARAARHAGQPADPLRRATARRSRPASGACSAGCGPGSRCSSTSTRARSGSTRRAGRGARARSRRPPGRRRRATRPARDATALSRWRLYAALEQSLRLHGDAQAAVELARLRRSIPFLPRRRGARAAAAAAARRGAAGARPRRASARGAREPGARRRAARGARGARAAGAPAQRRRGVRGCCGSA